MKNLLLAAAMLLFTTLAFSQEHPCPDIQSHSFVNTTQNPPTCTAYVIVFATGDIQSPKSMGIRVYNGNATTGTLISDTCFIVPKKSPSTSYQTSHFDYPCNATTITYVITRYTASNGSCQGGTCGITITAGGGPLPIKLSSFFAKRNGNDVVLNWKTESEINAKEFIVERNSGNGFVAVGAVQAKNLEYGSSYTFNDNNLAKSVLQYRLKMVDKDVNFTVSDIKIVKGLAAVSDFIVYPNPSLGNAKISVSDVTEATTVEVIDNSGRVVKTVEFKGSNFVNIDNLQKGIYLIRVTNKETGDALTKKLTVSN